MASIDANSTTGNPRHNGVSQTKVDLHKPHNSATARTAEGDYVADAREPEAKSGTNWLMIAGAAVLGLLLLAWILGAFSGEETVATPAVVDGDADVVMTTPAADPALTEEAAIVAPAADDAVVVEENAATAAPLVDSIDGEVTTTTVPVVPVEN